MIQTIATLKSWFIALKKPTEEQFGDMFDSLAHKTRDFDQMGGGLKDHNPSRVYTPGETAIKNGLIYRAIQGGTGQFDLAEWVPVKADPSSLGFENYDNAAEYSGNGIFRIYKLQLYRTINLASSAIEGIAPDDPTEGANFWEPIGYVAGANIPVWQPDTFVEYGSVYELGGTGEFATPGGYRCLNALANDDKGFFSSDFQTETEEGYWIKLWNAPGGSVGAGTLTETLTNGNETGGQDISFTSTDAIRFDNGSSIKKGTYDEGDGGGGGTEMECAVGYRFRHEAGKIAAYEPDGTTLRPIYSRSEIILSPQAPTSPSYGTSLTTKNFVEISIDNAINALKQRIVRFATANNITLIGDQNVDGGFYADDGDRILVMFQDLPYENGIYFYNSTSNWTRADDSSTAESLSNTVVYISQGFAYEDKSFRQVQEVNTINADIVVYVPFGQDTLPASPTVSGRSKLYNSVSGTSTDGSPDQASIYYALEGLRKWLRPTYFGEINIPTTEFYNNTEFSIFGPLNFNPDASGLFRLVYKIDAVLTSISITNGIATLRVYKDGDQIDQMRVNIGGIEDRLISATSIPIVLPFVVDQTLEIKIELGSDGANVFSGDSKISVFIEEYYGGID